MAYWFFLFTFILLAAIVLTSKDTLRAMFAASLVVNFLGITQHLIKFHKMGIFPQAAPEGVENMVGGNAIIADGDAEMTAPEYDRSMSEVYGEQYDDYMSYKTSYNQGRAVIPDGTFGLNFVDQSADTQGVMIEQRRTRDKQSRDGQITKDANYYRHHYADELRESENKPWWGRNEW